MRIVIAGAGYGGVRVAQELGKRVRAAGGSYRLTLVNPSPFHVIKTELHTIAGGAADDPGEVQIPLAELFAGLPVELVFRRIEGVAPQQNRLLLDGGEALEYDRLVLALGSSPEYFGIPGLAEHAYVLNDIEGALAIRRAVDDLVRGIAVRGAAGPSGVERGDGVERGPATGGPDRRRIVVGGGGLTGVELAGELAWSLRHRYARSGAGRLVAVTLVEGAPGLLPGLASQLGEGARERLERVGVEVLTGVQIREATRNAIVLAGARPDAKTGAPGVGASGADSPAVFSMAYDLLIWTGGVRGNRLLEAVFETDRKGRVIVDPEFRVERFPNVRVLGDAACVMDGSGRPAAPTAQAAVQQAAWVAVSLWNEVSGGRARAEAPYAAKSKGILASVGPDYGVGLLGTVPVHGRWVKWLKDANNVRYLTSIGAFPRKAAGVLTSPGDAARRAAGAGL